MPARVICRNISQMQSLGRQTSSLVEHLEVSDLARWRVLSWPLRLTFQSKRYKLPEIDVVLDQVIQHFDPAIMHAEPEGHEQVELEAADPLVLPLEAIDQLNRVVLVAYEYLA